MAKDAEYPYLGYTLYLSFHKKEKRMMAIFLDKNTKKVSTSTSYARYLMAVHLGRFLTKDEQVDHIDNDKSNDSINNLQILAPRENREKYARIKPTVPVLKICPICSKAFSVRFHLRKTKSCSRTCGGILARQTSIGT